MVRAGRFAGIGEAIIVHDEQVDVPLRLSDFDYELPDERIAQTPVEPRDSSRLLVVPRNNGELGHRRFHELPDLLRSGDLLVVNETRVTATRLLGTRSGGGNAEALLLRTIGDTDTTTWEALVRPGSRIRVGDTLMFEKAGLQADVIDRTADGGRILRLAPLSMRESVTDLLEAHGRVPLPPYINAPLEQKERYQTVYAKMPGSAAAPTAGLHFTPELLQKIEAMGVEIARVRLDVGLGTFRPIKSDILSEHIMHRESFEVSEAAAAAINGCTGRIIAVGTTTVRTLETAAQFAEAGRRIMAMRGETQLFVQPGFRFRVIDGLITNFHQPHSTLLLLVAAFAGRAQMRTAYQTALAENYRFLSFGDAMFVV